MQVITLLFVAIMRSRCSGQLVISQGSPEQALSVERVKAAVTGHCLELPSCPVEISRLML